MYRHPEYQYLGILQELAELLENEVILPDRTNTGVAKVIARLQRYNLAQDGFPLLTTKRVWFKGVAEELFWMLRGETNIRSLVMKGVNIWNEWPLRRYLEFKRMGDVTPNSDIWNTEMAAFTQRIKDDEGFAEIFGDVGPFYGKQWRRWLTPDGHEVDQLGDVIEALKENPYSRR